MCEHKSLIIDQITNSILCIITSIPVIWLLDKHTVLEKEALVCYYLVFAFIGLLLAAFDRLKSLYRISILVPAAVLAAFRDLSLFFTCLAALVLYVLCMLLYQGENRKVMMAVTTGILLILCIVSGDMPRVTAAAIAGLLVLCCSMFVKTNIRYALTLVVLIEGLALGIKIDTARQIMTNLARAAGQIVITIEDCVNDVKYYMGKYDTVSYLGYGEPGGMFQSLNDTNREELHVEVEGKIASIYLKGASYSGINENGVEGRVDENAADNSWFVGYLNALYHAGICEEEARCFSKILKVHVNYEYIRTKDVMRSSELIRLNQDSSGDVLGKDDEYSFSYVAFDYANPYLIMVVRQSAEEGGYAWESYETIREYAFDIYHINLSNLMDEDAYNKARMAYENGEMDERYLDDSFVTEKIQELTIDITKDCTNDYDRARRIEAYLRQYPYDTNVDYRGTDHYVEAFLFDEGRGYCAHYASAMVVMLRSIGIPARYTQGFRHNTGNGSMVYSNEAHAWPEAYINGYGWITFEPTGAYANAADSGWGLLPKEELEAGDIADRETLPYEELSMDDTGNIPDLPDLPAGQEGTASEMTAKSQNVWKLVWQIVRYLLGLLEIVIIFVLLYRIYEMLRYKRMSPTEKVIEDMTQLRKRMKRCLPNGTKAESVFDYLPYVQIEDYNLKEVFTNYYRIRFRGDEPEPEYVVMLHKLAGKRYKLFKMVQR